MAIADMTAERIFRTELFHLENETKRRLIELLVSSLDFSGRKGEAEKERPCIRFLMDISGRSE